MLSQRDWVANPTILSGDIGTPNSNFDNAYHVVFIDGSSTAITGLTVLEGFHIIEGNANENGLPNNGGGAIYHKGENGECSPFILNCKIYDNEGIFFGAVYNDGYRGISSPRIINCNFYDNISYQFGGAIVNDGRGNGGVAGLSNSKIANCTFYNNISSSSSSAIHNEAADGTANPTIENCILWENGNEIHNVGAVSYTHLTLPTICSV